MKTSLKIINKYGDNLTADFRYPENTSELTTEKIPLFIFCHGFKGFKDWGGFPYMLDTISRTGIFTVSFNFSYNGVGEDINSLTDFTRLELFANNTFSRELDDLGSIIDFLDANQNKYLYDFKNIILCGHSRGGGIAALKAAEDKRIKKLVTLASVKEFNRYSDEHIKKWKQKGYFEVLNTRTNQLMRMNYCLIEDLEKNSERLDILKAVSGINIPLLIIHGEQDLSVGVEEAHSLFDHSNKIHTSLDVIPGTGHTFGIEHPFRGSNPIFDDIINKIIFFIKEVNTRNSDFLTLNW